jgi:hypothetical protein
MNQKRFDGTLHIKNRILVLYIACGEVQLSPHAIHQ